MALHADYSLVSMVATHTTFSALAILKQYDTADYMNDNRAMSVHIRDGYQ